MESAASDERIFPVLNPEQLARIARFGKRRPVHAGELLFEQGERQSHFVVVLSGGVEVVHPTPLGTEELLHVLTPGQFSGEVDMLFGQGSVVRGRVREAGEVIEIDRESVRKLVVTDQELSDVVMRAFILRRLFLISNQKGSLLLVGSMHSAATLRLREFLTRNDYPFAYLEIESQSEVKALLEHFGVGVDEIPVVICRGNRVLRNPTVRGLADCIGLSAQFDGRTVQDLVVVGAGPAGLAAAVYAASEGLRVLVLEASGPGGQAACSSKIENYLGFPMGVSGAELAARAFTQAAKFGAEFSVSRDVARLVCDKRPYALIIDGGVTVPTRTVVIACGVRYRRLGLAELSRFESAGVYYAATHLEAQLCRGEEVIVVGGGNSAGQAAVFLSQRGRLVHLLVRGESLSESMSAYLVRRIAETPNIDLRLHTEVVGLEGNDRLERVRWRDNLTGATSVQPVRHLFVMTGALPNTSWLDGCLQLDDKGFVKTGSALERQGLHGVNWPLRRSPYLLESSMPGVFVVGDARSGSVKRVAAAVGEGAASIQQVHQVLREEK